MDYEKTKQKLLEVGLDFFEKKGYNATGVQEIATTAEIPKGSFYTYFSSKEDFGVQIIRFYTQRSIHAWKNSLDVASKSKDPYRALITTFRELTSKYEALDIKKGCLLGTLASEISEASEECRLELHSSVGQYIEILTTHLQKGQLDGAVRDDLEAEQLAKLMWDTWQGGLLRMKIEKSVRPVDDNLELLFQNLFKK